MTESRFITERNMLEGLHLVAGIEGFDAVTRPVAFWEGKLFMSGFELKSRAAAEHILSGGYEILKPANMLQGERLLGNHIDHEASERHGRPISDPASTTIWKEVMILPEEVWQRLELFHV